MPSALPSSKFKCDRVEVFEFAGRTVLRTRCARAIAASPRCGSRVFARTLKQENDFSSFPTLVSFSFFFLFSFFTLPRKRALVASTGHAKIARCATGERRRARREERDAFSRFLEIASKKQTDEEPRGRSTRVTNVTRETIEDGGKERVEERRPSARKTENARKRRAAAAAAAAARFACQRRRTIARVKRKRVQRYSGA